MQPPLACRSAEGVAADAPGHAVPELTGEHFLLFLPKLYAALRPQAYLEIGTRAGSSLKRAPCAAIAVDPTFQITTDVIGGKPACHFFQMPSDTFFQDYDPVAILRRPIDLAFLDGMHLFEFLLRDFANTERCCRPNSVIMMHDCVPIDAYIAERTDDPERRRAFGSRPDWWTGDVWKIVPVLRRYRPDLVIHAIDAGPTGLVLVTNLDPASTLLQQTYVRIVNEFADIDLGTYGVARYIDELNLIPTGSLSSPAEISARFWL